MELDFLQYINVVNVLACLSAGYVIKKWVKDVDNKWIPTTVFALGIAIQFGMTQQITVENFVIGAISGLSSTGFHQMFHTFIEKEKK